MCIKAMALSLMLASTHHVPGEFNESHGGLGLEVPVSCNTQVVGGTYTNSYYSQTGYAGVSYDRSIGPWVRVGAVATAVTGYDQTPALAAITMLVGSDEVAARVMHVPGIVSAFQVRLGF